ncbi:MAG TPA: glycogen debranching protein GlgX [Acidobacteriota bacterium]|nr:glycogen debranching protein GlgX [Acidobacteriota bacterium]
MSRMNDEGRARRSGPRQALLDLAGDEFEVMRGHPLPFGATVMRDGVNFALYSRRATEVVLVLFLPEREESVLELPLEPDLHKTGDVWHAFIRGIDPGIEYGYRLGRYPNPEPHLDRFDPSQVLIDPYSRALSGGSRWGHRLHLESIDEHVPRRHSLVMDDEFDWQLDRPLKTHAADSVIYELHVRGFTRHASSGVRHPGTYRGLTEKIPYLKDLGITAVELMPVQEFEERDNTFRHPETGRRLVNFWGYDPITFFAPNGSYAADGRFGHQVAEFKEMVRAFHQAGIEVILDVVFNHTGEGGEDGPTYGLRGIDNRAYYIVDPESGEYHNYSGCGNTVNCNHPVVRDMILDCLRYWVTEMHVDGFRFDLASILGRGRDGSVLANPPLLERIAADPVLADAKLIAEAWDAAGLYQVGTFPAFERWAEWNGRFRDDVRRFVKSDPAMVPSLALRLSGSPDLYHGDGRCPYHSINFVTAHDGFTLHDLVSYNHKHNLANGEDNRDGSDNNHSWNCGAEGPTHDLDVLARRRRQMRNLITLLMMSQGVPMLLAGDEMARTQQGNNNAYCQDNEISWVNWDLLEEERDLFRFFKQLIAFRQEHPVLRGRGFDVNGDDPRQLAWHGQEVDRPDWSQESRSLAMHLSSRNHGTDLYLIAHSHWNGARFQLPSPRHTTRWHRFIDTALSPPNDLTPLDSIRPLSTQSSYWTSARSVVVLVGKD